MEKMIAALGLLILVILFFKMARDINDVVKDLDTEETTTPPEITNTVTTDTVPVVKKPRKPRKPKTKDASNK